MDSWLQMLQMLVMLEMLDMLEICKIRLIIGIQRVPYAIRVSCSTCLTLPKIGLVARAGNLLDFWLAHLLSGLRTYLLACLLDSGLVHLITACLLQFWLAQLIPGLRN